MEEEETGPHLQYFGVFFPSKTESLTQGEPPYHPCASTERLRPQEWHLLSHRITKVVRLWMATRLAEEAAGVRRLK